MIDPIIFREYDIRGVYGRDFDENFAYSLGQAHVRYIQKHLKINFPNVSVGYDARLSSPSLAEAVIKGISESGGNVYRLGLITTPLSYFSTFQLPDLNGAIMITGSHNPPDYNGFKISVGKNTIFGSAIQELRQIIVAGDFPKGQGRIVPHDIFPSYIEKHKKEFGNLGSIKVVLDCGNGAAGCVVRSLYEACGLQPVILFEKPDGTFPNHHPDPTVEKNLKSLIEKVKDVKAHIGIGFDGDCDRIGVVDSEGNMLPGDEMMVLVGRDLLARQKNQIIIGDVKCSDRMFTDLQARGGRPIMWKTGHSLIKQKIKEEKAPFGGELSGHIFFADRNYGYDDALYAGLRLIEILARTKKTIPQLLEGLPGAFNTPEIRIDTTEEKKVSIVKVLQEKYATPPVGVSVNLIDGIRISYPDGWALVRSSNTQPVVVMRFESNSKAGLQRIQSEIELVVNRLL